MRLKILMVVVVLMSMGLVRSSSAQGGCEDCNEFTLTSSFTGGGTVDGSLILDTTTNSFSGADITLAGFPAGVDTTFTSIASQGEVNGLYQVELSNSNDGLIADLDLQVSSLTGYDGSSLSSAESEIAYFTHADPANPEEFYLESGTLEPPLAPTPEPGSWMLLGTGLVGLMGLGWKRFV